MKGHRNIKFWQHSLLASFLLSSVAVSPVVAAPQTIEERLDRLERMADNPAMIQLSRRLAEQHREIQSLYGEVDRLKHKLKQLEETQASQYQEEDKRLSELEQATKAKTEVSSDEVSSSSVTAVIPDASQAIDAKPVTSESTTPVKEPSAESDDKLIEIKPATASEKKAYGAAFKLMKDSNYRDAVDAFAQFLESYPSSSLASNSGYWQGEAEAVLGNDKKALAAFKKVYQTYPTTRKAADAMLRAADILSSLGEADEAKVLYQRCIKDYANLPAAKKAARRLKEVSGASS